MARGVKKKVEPERVPAPYVIKQEGGSWVLAERFPGVADVLLKPLLAMSEDGRHREGLLWLRKNNRIS